MNLVYVAILSGTLSIISATIALILSFMLKKTNQVIEDNTAAYNKLSVVVATIQTKDEGDIKLCDEKHSSINRLLQRQDDMLQRHDTDIQYLKRGKK